jgi:hypothetical protein
MVALTSLKVSGACILCLLFPNLSTDLALEVREDFGMIWPTFPSRKQTSPEVHLAGNIILNDSRAFSKVLARRGRQNSLECRARGG